MAPTYKHLLNTHQKLSNVPTLPPLHPDHLQMTAIFENTRAFYATICELLSIILLHLLRRYFFHLNFSLKKGAAVFELASAFGLSFSLYCQAQLQLQVQLQLELT